MLPPNISPGNSPRRTKKFSEKNNFFTGKATQEQQHQFKKQKQLTTKDSVNFLPVKYFLLNNSNFLIKLNQISLIHFYYLMKQLKFSHIDNVE
jgi:hypothetical protein